MSSQRTRLTRLLGVLTGTVVLAMVAGAAASIPAEINVVLQDNSIEMADSTAAGNAVFLISNDGEMEHAFKVQTVGTEPSEVAALKANVAPGESTRLEAVLAPGTYEVLCPLPHHENRKLSGRIVAIEETSR